MVPVWMTLNDLWPIFQGHDILRQITRTRYNIELCLQWRTNRTSYMIYRTAPCSITLNDPYPRFQDHAIFDAEYHRNGMIYRQFQWNTDRDLHTPYSTVSFRMTLSYLAKYSMTRSVVRFICDSWASCNTHHRHSENNFISSNSFSVSNRPATSR